MAAQGFCTFQSIPAPLEHAGGGTPALRVTIVSPIHVVWADASIDDYPADTTHRAALSAYDSATSVDGSAFVWLVIVSQGTANLWIVKEADYATIGTLGTLTGQWALHSRIDGDALYRVPQV